MGGLFLIATGVSIYILYKIYHVMESNFLLGVLYFVLFYGSLRLLTIIPNLDFKKIANILSDKGEDENIECKYENCSYVARIEENGNTNKMLYSDSLIINHSKS